MILLLCVASGGTAYYLGSRYSLQGSPEEKGQPQDAVIDGLSIPVSRLSVGEVWEDKSVVLELPIRNTTSETMNVREILSSCGCMQITPRKLAIPGGETGAVQIQIDALARRPFEIGEAERPFFYDITPITRGNDTNRAKSWRIEGVLRSRLTLNKLKIHFGESVIVGQPTIPMKVEATIHIQADRIVATVKPEAASIRISRRSDDPTRYELSITPKASLPKGAFKADVTLELEQPDGSRVFGATFPVEGVVQPEIRALPSRMLLGPKKVGETATGIVVLQVPPGSTLAIEQIETDSDDVHATPTSVDGIPEGRAYRVNFRLKKEGDQSAALHFVLRKANGVIERLRVEVNAFGEVVK